MILGRIDLADSSGYFGGLLVAATQETRRLQVVIEQIAECLFVRRIELHCPLKVLPGFRGVRRRKNRTRRFRSAAIRPSEPMIIFGAVRLEIYGFVKRIGGSLEIPEHDLVASAQAVTSRRRFILGRGDLQ